MTSETLRPNGKAYRAQKPPRVSETCDSYDDEGGVIVERTHDPAAAKVSVERMWISLGYDLPLPEPLRGWYRLVPRNGEFTWVEDPVRGAPCLIYGAWAP